jgi:hypothetical protein
MYFEDFNINEFKIIIGNIPWNQGIFLDLTDEKIVDAIKNKDMELMDAIFTAQYHSKEIAAIHFFKYGVNFCANNFNWDSYLRGYASIIEAKLKACTVLSGEIAGENIKHMARIFLNACDGDHPEYIPTEQDIKNRKQNRYRDSRAKWLRLLVESMGYKCTKCDHDKDLRIKHLVSIMNGGETELSNLEFRCSKHMNSK